MVRQIDAAVLGVRNPRKNPDHAIHLPGIALSHPVQRHQWIERGHCNLVLANCLGDVLDQPMISIQADLVPTFRNSQAPRCLNLVMLANTGNAALQLWHVVFAVARNRCSAFSPKKLRAVDIAMHSTSTKLDFPVPPGATVPLTVRR